MSVWFREVAGWLLVLAGLAIVVLAVLLLLERAVVEAGPMAVLGVMVLRAGIHLLKVAVAARVCAEAVKAQRGVRA